MLKRKLIGLDSTAYAQVRAQRADAERLHLLDSLSLRVASAEIERLRKELAGAYGLLQEQKALTAKAEARGRPTMLLDPNYYKGYIAGLLTGGFLGARYLPKF